MLALHNPSVPAVSNRPQFMTTQPETTIKTAMAAGLGSSLVLFHGLHSLSPHIFAQAGLPPSPTSPRSPVSPHTPDTKMGGCASKDASPHHHRQGAGYASTENLNPRPYQHQHQRQQQQPKHSSRRRTPHPEYRLHLTCASCTASRRDCSIARDYNMQCALAYTDSPRGRGSEQQQAVSQSLKTWTVELDFCSWAKVKRDEADRAKAVLADYLGDPYSYGEDPREYRGKGSRRRPICVEEFKEKLGGRGVGFRSSL
ncbi:uncharacterized protein B0T15DRAFT_189618 [Chaetomium strumarium]|uniref:Uncharacterized protein n=1 Tax=Chaetomium strumarium TaxID=1170767 RepID=A0AAJ0M163_9PEZI|nr:hypothetical protein B0T15DRAFT_189618 [Chaetomium strumarium]